MEQPERCSLKQVLLLLPSPTWMAGKVPHPSRYFFNSYSSKQLAH